MKPPFILSIILLPLTTIQADKYKKAGDTVVLSPGSVSAPITSITWKHNSNLAVEWYGQEIDFYPKFKDRCKLNTATGELTFPDMTLEYSGRYTPEINNRVLNPIEILVISAVPTPTVSKSCDDEKTHCVLTCEGNYTTDAEPVTYTWWSGNVTKSKTKELNITKEDKEPSFSCKLENRVSSESSKEVANPFITSSSNTVNQNLVLLILVFVLILVILVILVVVGVLLKVKRRTVVPPVQISTEYDTVHAANNDYVQMPDCDRTVYSTVQTVNKRPDYVPVSNCDRTVYATVQDVSNGAG